MSTVLTSTTTPSSEDSVAKRAKRDLAALQNPADQAVHEIVQLFKLLADETRIRILHYLQQTDELNVRELCKLLRQRQPSVSHHLALLRIARLIDMRRDGKHNFYRLVPNRLEQFMSTFSGSLPGQPARVCFEGFELRFTPQGNQSSSQ